MAYRLTITDFRSFHHAQSTIISPLTILIGENSAGKSSYLGLLNYIYSSFSSPIAASFNQPPFFLGSFDQIAHYRGGAAGRARSFEVRIEASVTRQSIPGTRSSNSSKERVDANLSLIYANFQNQPVLKRATFAFDSNVLILETIDGIFSSLNLNNKQVFSSKSETFRAGRLSFIENSIGATSSIIMNARYLAPRPQKQNESDRILIEAESAFRGLRRVFSVPVYASAPVRSNAARAYTPTDIQRSPEGGHVPFLMARAKRHEKKSWEALKPELDRFGQEAGLFKKIDVRRLGRSESDPFQLQVNLGGPERNIIDVGYGVSQVLPIVIDPILNDNKSLYLLQQPEVHLHPRAQAALGEFFVEMASAERNFVIETHSDYILDRVRYAVRDKRIKKESVSIIYFDRTSLETRLHAINLNDHGEIIDPPAGYREFFVREAERAFE